MAETDLINIGIGVDSSQLEKGVATLNAFSSTAKKTNSSAQSIGVAMNSASKVFAAAVAAMSKSISSLVSITKGATVEQIAAAKEASEFADRVYRAAQAQDKLATSTQKAAKAVNNQYAAFMKLASKESVLDRINALTGVTGLSGGSARLSAMAFQQGMSKDEWTRATGGLTRDVMPNRFNTANIAAQFQDIGVTAAMGMNPMLIALQQGTQLAAVMNSMEAPLRGLKDAFLQIINPVSLLSIGLTALAVVGLQTVDWVGVAESGLNTLATGMDFIANNAETVAAAIGVIGAALIVLNAGAIASTAKILLLRTALLGLTVVETVGKVVASAATMILSPWILIPATIIGAVEAFYMFKDGVKSSLNAAIQTVVDFVNKVIGYFVGLKNTITEIPNILKTAYTEGFSAANDKITDIMKEAEGHEYINADGVKSGVNKAVDFAANGIGRINEIIGEGVSYLGEGLGKMASGAADKLRDWASGLRETSEEAEKANDAWKKLQTELNQDIASLEFDQNLIGVSTYKSVYEKTKQDLINQASNAGIILSTEQLKTLDEGAKKIATVKSETEILSDSFDFTKNSTNSFFQDMREGLMEGQSLWKSFGDAVTNVLDRILSKMIDVGVDLFFQSSSEAGWFKGIGSSLFGGSGITQSGGSISSGFSVVANANGGVYTNGVYNSPTLFKFASGGKFGVMGEAGPEAVMPLHKAPDGSLGVRADITSSGNNKDVIVNVYNNSNTRATVNQRQTSQGTEIDVMIDQVVAEKISQPGTATNSSALALNNRRLISR